MSSEKEALQASSRKALADLEAQHAGERSQVELQWRSRLSEVMSERLQIEQSSTLKVGFGGG